MSHVTQCYFGSKKKWTSLSFDPVHGQTILGTITHYVTQKKTGATAFKIDLGDIPCATQIHILHMFYPNWYEAS